MYSVLKIDSGSYWTLQYEGQVANEPAGERGGLTVPSEAKGFAHSSTIPGRALAWPWASNDDSINRNLAGPNKTGRVFASVSGSKEFNVAHGKGQLVDPANGAVIYAGEFHRGWFNGNGVGRIYEEGAGAITFAGIYKGQYAFGLRHGNGELTDPDGGVYVGEWKYDRRHGKGKETDPSGAVYYGCWRSGEKHGFGKLVWPNAPKCFDVQQWDSGRLLYSHAASDDNKSSKDVCATLIETVEKLAGDIAKSAPAGPAPSIAAPVLNTADAAPAAIGTPPTGPLKLEDKRRLKELQEKVVPTFQTDIKALTPVPFEVDWDSFSNNASPATAVFMLAAHDCSWVLKPVKTALTSLLDTDLMKKEFSSIVKKIVLRNKEKLHDPFEVTVESDVMYISATFSAGATSRITADKLKAEFDKKL